METTKFRLVTNLRHSYNSVYDMLNKLHGIEVLLTSVVRNFIRRNSVNSDSDILKRQIDRSFRIPWKAIAKGKRITGEHLSLDGHYRPIRGNDRLPFLIRVL